MKIFVTVGTTKFDGLIRYVDEHFKDSIHEFTLQIADGNYTPDHFPYFNFTDEIKDYYRDCDLVISHGGAGSIYRLLELQKKIIVVPNLERKDRHQLDIARYMSEKNYVLWVSSFDKLTDTISRCETHQFDRFRKQDFFAADKILDFLIPEVVRKP
ncbi:MAG: glycosyltransferase [Acidobacteria bacterium CG_4_9_14_3_um_filter_49_7]|nr:MAG: glycosyltransferase [Acidobacteria bacterium CG_4_9_14_3_um_filter_49_7]